jgi:hypothetical protein
VLLEPKKGTQGRGMNRKIRIASALALAGFLSASAPMAASAGSPLLSGYGGPGAGEQAIVGSTFLGGPHGGASSGGAGLGGLGGTLSGAGNSTPTGGRTGSGGSSSARRSPASGGASQAGAKLGRAGTSAFVYPSSLRFASASSPALGISGGDLVLLAAIIATLALVGTLTIRLARLQP